MQAFGGHVSCQELKHMTYSFVQSGEILTSVDSLPAVREYCCKFLVVQPEWCFLLCHIGVC